jgi:polyisoprenoid-binding protein YceI
MQLRKLSLVGLVVVLMGAAPNAATYDLVTGSSSITYQLTHKLKQVHGTSKQMTGKARMLLGEKKLQVGVKIPVASFDSANGNRDVHMQEATEAAHFPNVEFKGVAEGVELPSTFPSKASVSVAGVLTFHGVQQKVTIPLSVNYVSPKHITADGTFTVSLESFKIQRPSLMFVAVDDNLVMTEHLELEAEP